MIQRKFLLALALASVSVPAAAQVDETNRLVDEGMNRSQVMTLAQEMTDEIGPRPE